MSLGIYVHIPFCRSKCPYCDFYSEAGARRERMEAYAGELAAQIREYAPLASGRVVETIYIGGGTPTVMPRELLLGVIGAVKDSYELAVNAEFTAEANPASADSEYLSALRRVGVNRLSLGMQSSSDEELRRLGRAHKYASFLESLKAAREAGFANLSVDLMYGIPSQTRASFAASLKAALAASPEHISIYSLKLEPGTPFFERGETLPLPGEEEERAMYFDAINALTRAGYAQYEISNFARPGFECRHNLNYWDCGEYLGFGAGAHSFFGGRRYSFKPSLTGFGGEIGEDGSNIGREGEYVMLAMRRAQGIGKTAFGERFGRDFDEAYRGAMEPFIESGHIVADGSGYRLTPEGMYVSNYILARII